MYLVIFILTSEWFPGNILTYIILIKTKFMSSMILTDFLYHWRAMSLLMLCMCNEFHIVHVHTMYSTLQVYQRSNSQIRHIPPKMSDKFEGQHSLIPTIWSDILVRREWILKDFFLHFSRWICQTFCDRCVFVNVLSFR